MRRFLWRGIKTGLVLGSVAVVVLWFVLEHKPGWYRPGVATETAVHSAQTETAALVDLIGDNLVGGRSFDVTLLDRQVNGWLACLDHILPSHQYRLPPELSDPAVRFDEGLLRIGVHYSENGWRAILNAALRAELTDGGRSIRVSIVQVRIGSLAAPRWLLRPLLNPHWKGVNSRPADEAGQSRFDSLISGVQSVDDLFQGVTIRNRFVWPNGERAFRVGSIRSDAGATRVRIEPL